MKGIFEVVLVIGWMTARVRDRLVRWVGRVGVRDLLLVRGLYVVLCVVLREQWVHVVE